MNNVDLPRFEVHNMVIMAKKKLSAKKTKGNEEEKGGAYGNPAYPYSTTPNSLRRFLSMAPEKPKPSKITADTLKIWNLKNSNDYTILRVLKSLELLSQTGEPTAHYADFMKKDTGPAALGKRIKILYDNLFQNVPSPEKASNDDLKNFFNIHSGGGERTIQYQIDTFKALASYATFGSSDPLVGSSGPDDLNQGFNNGTFSGPTIKFDLHIHLPENKTKADYDAIMESIAHHLYRQNRDE